MDVFPIFLAKLLVKIKGFTFFARALNHITTALP